MADPKKVFSLEGKGLKLTTAEDLEPHIKDLRALEDLEEIRLLGNTLGVGACKLLGEILATKKTLQVSDPKSQPLEVLAATDYTDGCLDRKPRRHLYRPPPE